jgi:DNA modification methylase
MPIKWPADKVVRKPVADLIPYAKNARTHSAEQIEQLASSIKEWGWTTPILIDEAGTIIAGHGRVMAAQSLGITDVPVMVAEGWTDAQRRAYVIADNKLALNAGWDDDLLKIELSDLQDVGFDLGLAGFAPDELSVLFADKTAGLTDPDDVPEPPADPVSALGDIWQLGKHRIICGDSTEAATVEALLDGEKPHLMVTDPPYGVSYDPDWRNHSFRKDGSPIAGGAIGKVTNDDRADWRDAWALFPGNVIYCWHPAGANSIDFYHGLADSGFPIRMQIIWNKSNAPIGRGDYHVKHEPCWYAVRKGKTGHWAGDRKQTTVWDIPKPAKSETGHSTQKPVECMKRPIENNSQPGDAVYEPFSGSGTTIIAGEMTGRRVFAVELHPAYVDMAVIRWQQFTGNEAVLASTGQTYAAVQDERSHRSAA